MGTIRVFNGVRTRGVPCHGVGGVRFVRPPRGGATRQRRSWRGSACWQCRTARFIPECRRQRRTICTGKGGKGGKGGADPSAQSAESNGGKGGKGGPETQAEKEVEKQAVQSDTKAAATLNS